MKYAQLFIKKLWLLCFLFGAWHTINCETKKDLKILVLIIASDNFEVYEKLEKIWRSYMHNDPEHVEAYFIKGDPTLKTPYKIHEDVIWLKTPESLKPGIINKTILALEALLPRIQKEFDYVLRTNLSSFYIFPRLFRFLRSKYILTPLARCFKIRSRKRFYCASYGASKSLGSGSGFLISPDIAQLLVKNKNFFLNNSSTYDDVLIGQFLATNKIKFRPHRRMGFLCLDDWEKHKNNIPKYTFQFRVKNKQHDLRLIDDVYIHEQLLNAFYR